jgi:hypothetical protein
MRAASCGRFSDNAFQMILWSIALLLCDTMNHRLRGQTQELVMVILLASSGHQPLSLLDELHHVLECLDRGICVSDSESLNYRRPRLRLGVVLLGQLAFMVGRSETLVLGHTGRASARMRACLSRRPPSETTSTRTPVFCVNDESRPRNVMQIPGTGFPLRRIGCLGSRHMS